MELTFLGATGTVTGSKYLLTLNRRQILVDCGLFQGYKELRLRNWKPLPLAVDKLEALVLTHAHIDHSGYLPLLVKNGFKGKIFCSAATRDLCAILLPDSGYLQEEEARLANKYGYSKHHPALPLYTKAEAEQALEYFQPVRFGVEYRINDELTFMLHHAGHILGASIVQLRQGDTTLVFSGDLGRPHDPIMRAPAVVQMADYLVLESTYGNRRHDLTDPGEQLAAIINHTAKRGGSVLMPAFAVGRAQLLIYYLYQLKKTGRIPPLPIFLDSPMAIDATKVLCEYAAEHRLSFKECGVIFSGVRYINTPEQSQQLAELKVPAVIISASGMATGGRVLHHLERLLPDYRNTVLFTGFQASGTRGARLVGGETEIKIHGQMIPVRAEVKALSNLSAHADYAEILAWLRKFTRPPRQVFITHGEPEAAQALHDKIVEELGWNCTVPEHLQTVQL